MSPPHQEHDTSAEARLQRENDHLAAALAALEARMPSVEEVAYVRNRMAAEEHSAWAVKIIRSNAPWIFLLLSALGSSAYWLLTHEIKIDTKP